MDAGKRKAMSMLGDDNEPPIGPESLVHAFQWNHDFVKTVLACGDLKSRLLSNLQHSWDLSSNYSGMCTEETACAALQIALAKQRDHPSFPDFKVVHRSACDNDGYCQALLLGMPGSSDRKPQHCFQDLNGFLKADVVQELDQMEESVPRPSFEVPRSERKRLNQERADMYKLMGKYLLSRPTSELVSEVAHCVLHFQACPFKFTEPWSIQVAGLTCVAFSPFGNMEGMAHESMRSFFVWATLMRHLQPTLVVAESAHLFPRDLLVQQLGGLYDWHFLDHDGPIVHGWPLTRPRMWAMGFLRSKVTFCGSAEEYFRLFSRSLRMNGDDMFFLEKESVDCQQEFKALCQKRGVQHNHADSLKSWDRMYSANQQTNIRTHALKLKKLAAAMMHESGDDVDPPPLTPFITDLEQNYGFALCGANVPCLIRHGLLYSFRKRRHLCLRELMACQGFPTSKLLKADYEPAFQRMVDGTVSGSVASTWRRSTWHKLLGNGMFIPTLASILLYSLANMVPCPAKLLRMTSHLRDSQDEDGEDGGSGSRISLTDMIMAEPSGALGLGGVAVAVAGDRADDANVARQQWQHYNVRRR